MIKLTSSDNVEFSVENDIMFNSLLIKDMIENLENVDQAIPLSEIKGDVLKIVIHFCSNKKLWMTNALYGKEKNFIGIKFKDSIIDDINKQDLFDVLVASIYLDIQELTDFCASAFARMISGMTADEVLEKFSNDD